MIQTFLQVEIRLTRVDHLYWWDLQNLMDGMHQNALGEKLLEENGDVFEIENTLI